MPELPVTDEQLRRLRAVCSDLEAAYVGPYGRVQPADALEYLLDTYTPPEEAATDAGAGTAPADAGARAAADAGGGDAGGRGVDSASEDGDGGDAESEDDDLTAIDGVGEVTAAALADAGFDSLSAIEAADPAALTEADGVGEKQAVDIVAAVAGMDRGGSDGTGRGGDGSGVGAAGPGAGDPSDSPEDTLQQAMSLLDAHDDRWREGSGDEPYEVDRPDGSTEAVRTKDDVKRLLFEHWR